MPRAVLIVLDSLGIGGAPDAASYGDEGADTLGHIEAAAAAGRADRAGLRSGPLLAPHLARLGLFHAAGRARGEATGGRFGRATERSRGKDTPSGHWEIAGVPVPFEWGYFPRQVPCFPPDLVAQLVAEARLPGVLGERHASGTEIIAELGEESVATGRPILYTSADSVLQIAAHEESFGLERLLELCRIARRLVDPLRIGRVIARPFTGTSADNFRRTANRRDFAVPPPEPTLLDRVSAAGGAVHAVGKVSDIFAGQGVTRVLKAADNGAVIDAALAALREARDGDLVFANCVDFDMVHGHRRDTAGYAAEIERFDARVPELTAALRPGDLLCLTADHGCDPTWEGTDHTREAVPVLFCGPGLAPGPLPPMDTFADIGESIAAHLGLPPGRHGRSVL
ncbi:phosphopentomutase [Aureimonas jatrophae]|uniref:Phosphopentomutase n=1 Tax=Aureimonas jatrophae TaxID=1166073 RepID=A0A1H0LTW9_9HYPH|nr:phosphopentomutase [Aureimonas jatrophae]MBB3952741.1 phosphopentomutase [Aureimonas jatrophae]SDO71491.1 phosphopentomutase [Aureimonas jatrophae]